MNNDRIIENNKSYWNEKADLWFGTTALPTYGVKFVTEDDLHLFGDVSGKKMLEICCGSGHSFHKSYFDESYFTMPVHDSEIILCNRKISTYVNALAKAGFVIEQMIEQNDEETMQTTTDMSDKTRKAKMVPISVCFKARKL